MVGYEEGVVGAAGSFYSYPFIFKTKPIDISIKKSYLECTIGNFALFTSKSLDLVFPRGYLNFRKHDTALADVICPPV